MAEEWDPYAQHNEVPEVGYIDPPAEPYRYVSPIRRDAIYSKNSAMAKGATQASGQVASSSASNATAAEGGKRSSPLSQPLKPSAILNASPLGKPKVCTSCGTSRPVMCDAGVQTMLTLEQLTAALAAAAAIAASTVVASSYGIGARATSARKTPAAVRRPGEPVRASSSKRIPVVTSAQGPSTSVAPRTKSSNKVPAVEGESAHPVVAAPRATRLGPSSPKNDGASTPHTTSLTSLGGRTPNMQLLDVTPTVARKMFSGGNSSSAVRNASTGKGSSVTASTTLLKRGKSTDRPATLGAASSASQNNAVLQAALARNLLRKQASSVQKPEAFSSQPSGTASTARRHVSEFATAGEGSPSRPASTLAANLPSSLSPQSATLSGGLPAKFSRGPSSGGHGSSAVASVASSQRRTAGLTASSSSNATIATKRISGVTGAVPAPTRTTSSRPVVRKVTPTPGVTTSHVDPTIDSHSELKKAQGVHQQIVHQQASLEDRERARQWQQKSDDKVMNCDE